MKKSYFIVFILLIGISILVWRLSSSYAVYNQGYEGNNYVTGDKWSVNIIKVNGVKTTGKAIVDDNIKTIGTTLSFKASLFEKGDTITFDFQIKNTGKLNAELYATTLTGLSQLDSEVISYEILPLNSIHIHEEQKNGSIIKNNETQSFRVIIRYEDNVAMRNKKEYNLGLGLTVIYRQQ